MGDVNEPEVIACVQSIVDTLSVADGAMRWAAAADVVAARASAELAGRLRGVAAGVPAVPAADVAHVAELERRAHDLLDTLTAPQTKLVCREIRRVSSSRTK